MTKWRYKVLKNQVALDLIKKNKELVRIEKYDGAPHLQLKEINGYKTIGRIRKDLFNRLPFVLSKDQSPFINISWWIVGIDTKELSGSE